MKIKTTANIEADVEVDVDIGDVLVELRDKADMADPGHWRAWTPTIDCLTRIMLLMPPETIQAMPAHIKLIIQERMIAIAGQFDEDHK